MKAPNSAARNSCYRLSCLIACLWLVSASAPLRAQGDPFELVVPTMTIKMFDLDGKAGGTLLEATDRRVGEAAASAKQWHSQLFAADKLPPLEAYRFYEDVDGELDVVRARVEDEDFVIATAQSRIAMAVLITPKAEGVNPLELLKKKCGFLFAKEYQIKQRVSYDRWPKVISVPQFNLFLQDSLLGAVPIERPLPEGFQEFRLGGKGLAKWYAAHQEEMPPEIRSLIQKGKLVGSPSVWYRMIHIWTDGKRVGFYFLKDEEGNPLVLSFNQSSNWFLK